ncbi:hypothetical protein Y045_5959 [Burkholderia pseudomallei MSHR2451]|nr:hypothetical protein X990_5626 [Burkholderia pseudomallei MSHR4868]KGW37034.1 hypothetical protein Y045_5959 [Burkholderia pseudomallei MSHR2451]
MLRIIDDPGKALESRRKPLPLACSARPRYVRNVPRPLRGISVLWLRKF